MQFFIKNLGIILCCVFQFTKITNYIISKKQILINVILSVFCSALTTITDCFFPAATIPCILILSTTILTYTFRHTIIFSFVTTIISFALSYILFAMASFICSIAIIFLPFNLSHTISQALVFIVQIILMPIPYHIDRFKKGMPFLQRNIYTIPIVCISTTVLIIGILLNCNRHHIIYVFLFFLLIIPALLIYQYWKSNLTKTYIDKLKDRNIWDLNQQIAQQTAEIIRLKEENEKLSKIVHKDNQLIPTLEHTIHTFIQNNSITDQHVLIEGNAIIERLSNLSKDRNKLLKEQDITCKKISMTEVSSIDQYLKYFQCEATKSNIEFQVCIDCDIPYFIEHIIEEYDLETLIQDLLDDALHATQANNGRYILLSIGIVSKSYTINIFDSGIPFTMEVLSKWGLEQITTRADDGGSGIGMMNTYETLKKYNASFIIQELGTNHHTFTKEVTISFNNRNQYILQTGRSEEELMQLAKRPDLQIIRQ